MFTAPVARFTEATRLRLTPLIVVNDPPTNRRVPSVASVFTAPFVSATKPVRTAPVLRSNAARRDRVSVPLFPGPRTCVKEPPT